MLLSTKFQELNHSTNTDAIDALPNAIHAFGGPDALARDSHTHIHARDLFQDTGALDVDVSGYSNSPSNPHNEVTFGGPAVQINGPGLSDTGTFVLVETSLDTHCWGLNRVVTAKLQLNGQDRFSEREGSLLMGSTLSSSHQKSWTDHLSRPITVCTVW